MKIKFFISIVVMFFIFFGAFKIIGKYPSIIYNLNLNVHCNSHSSNVFKSIFKGMICFSNFNIDNNVSELNFLINPKNLMLSKSIMEDVINGDYQNYNSKNKSFKSKIIFEKEVYESKVKFHGKNPSSQHIKDGFFSMDVKILNGKSINGLTSFDLILKDRMNPRSLFIPFISLNKIIYQNSNLIKVKINSSEWQYFYIQPNRDEKFFYDYGLNIFLPNIEETPHKSNRGFVFEENFESINEKNIIFKNIEDLSHRESIANKYNELNSFIFNKKEGDVSRFFNIEYLANFLAIYMLLGCDTHGNTDGNLLVGYNIDNGKFYPIAHRDYNARYLSDSNFSDCFNDKQFLQKLFNISLVKNKTIESLKSIDKDFLEIQKKYENELKKYYLTTSIGSYIYHFHREIFDNDLELFTKNMAFLRQNYFKEQNVEKKNSGLATFNENHFRKIFGDSNLNFIVDYKDKVITLFGENIIRDNIDFPPEFKVIIKASASIDFEKKAYLKFHNDLIIKGEKDQLINIYGNENGTLIVSDLFNSNNKLIIENTNFEKMVENIHDGVRYMGGITVLSESNAEITNSTFEDFLSEDVINIKGFNKLSANLLGNEIIRTLNDGVDLDFVKKGIVTENRITAKIGSNNDNSDGLDFSRTSFEANFNLIQNFPDKCISIGEGSFGNLKENRLTNCRIGIANKDGSIINLFNNYFLNNRKNVSSYIKKKSYKQPIENYVE